MLSSFNRLTQGTLGWSLLVILCGSAQAQVYNLKVVTDATPDYSDMESMIRGITSRWESPADKCWAMFYWNHLARRQTAPMILHGQELTDPIRQFNDYGYTMCSTVAGINTSIWRHMGLKVKFWDISLHTVSECEYGGRWHVYDNSMSAIYTLCDGVTIAGVEDVGREGACPASAGRTEPGHVARYHCLNATSANGFLTGADTPRDLAQEYRCFKLSGLKYRAYYNNWEWGHRYILNLRENAEYTRYYRSLGAGTQFFVPNRGKDPDATNTRYHIRGNGSWRFSPSLTPDGFPRSHQTATNIQVVAPAGLRPARPAEPAEVVFKVQSANVATAQTIHAKVFRGSADDSVRIAVSTTNGLQWRDVWSAEETGSLQMSRELLDEVSGAYEILVRVSLQGQRDPADARLDQLDIETTTMLNSKTQPSLRLGRNEVFVGVGPQTDSVVFWPELQDGRYKNHIVQERNISSKPEHPGYQGVLYAVRPNEEAFVVYRIDAPRPITGLTYGGRFYNRIRKGEIELLHSFDEGRSWQSSYVLRETEMPWDDIHFETVTDVPAHTKSVLCKYRLFAPQAGTNACSIYSVRMEVAHQPAAPGPQPVDVTFHWSEVQPDRSLLPRSHTQRVPRFPFRYTLNVGGSDHPVVDFLRVSLASAAKDTPYGYSDGTDSGGDRFVGRWVSYGPNLLKGKPYQVSVPPTGQWGGSDRDGTKLTDGIVGPSYPGGIAPSFGCIWDAKCGQPEITVDMGRADSFSACCIHLTAGWPWWNALQGEVKDNVEVLTSTDGQTYQSRGTFELNLWRKDVPVNHFLPDEETACGWNYVRAFDTPVTARYVRFKITPQRALAVTEVQAIQWIKERPFDFRIALPDEQGSSPPAATQTTKHGP